MLKIDLFSDPACPWCLLGLARLDKAIAALPAGTEIEIEHHPYLLDANAPEEGEDVVEMLRLKYGNDPYEMWDHLEEQARASGIDLDMRKQPMRYATQAAQALIAAARAKGTQHKLARAIGDAYYLDALNIADADVLVPIAEEHGFAAEEARAIVTDRARFKAIEAAAAHAAQQGIRGVPFFVFDQKLALSGAQPEEVFTRTLEQVLEEG